MRFRRNKKPSDKALMKLNKISNFLFQYMEKGFTKGVTVEVNTLPVAKIDLSRGDTIYPDDMKELLELAELWDLAFGITHNKLILEPFLKEDEVSE